MSRLIAQSLSLSGNVVVLQAWAVERLSLHGHASHGRFPCILRWFPYNSRTKKIEHIFQTGDLNLEWYVSKQDLQLPKICAAFHMDDGGMGEGSLTERCMVEEADDESSDDGTWEVDAEERMRKNNQNIITLNAKIGVLTRELIEICQTPIFNEEVACGNDEEVGGGGHEAPAGGGDEEGDGGFDEEAVGGAAEDHAGAFNEQLGDDEPAYEDEKVSASHHPSVCIEIDDDGDDDEGEVVPLAIPPLRSFVGDLTTTVDVDQLYYAVSVRDSVHK
ncbi:uncharacterized protein LOC128194134 [Vigna angularis]|nr:uncharacterized protein LOC128194134 [Vigna angularis]